MKLYWADGKGGRKETETPLPASDTLLGGVKIRDDSGLEMRGEYLNAIPYELPTASETVKGGVKVGAGLEMLGDVLTATAYELPTASETVKGGVKVGAGLTMDRDSLTADAYLLPTASPTIKGGVKIGEGLSMAGEFLNTIPYELPTASMRIKGGVKVGNGLEMAGESLNVIPYELPTASTITKGGVKIGEGLTMAGDTLNAEAYHLPIASTTTRGGIKIGNGLIMTDETLSVEQYLLPTASKSTKGGIAVGKGFSMSGDTLNCTVEGDSFFHDAGFARFSYVTGSESYWEVGEVETEFTDNIGRPSKQGDIVNWGNSGATKGYALRVANKWYNLGTNTYDRRGNLTDSWSLINPILTLDDRQKLNGLENYTLPTASKTQKGGIAVGTGLTMSGDTLNAVEQYTLPTASKTVKGGIKVGSGLGMNEDTLNVTLEPYTLPTASKTVKGGIIVGSGLSIAGDKLNVALETYTLPTASKTQKGGIAVGTGLTMSGDTLNVVEQYTLPTAGVIVKGGVKVGSGLTMDGETLNVVEPEVYVLPTASADTKGGIKVGSGLSMSGDTLKATYSYTLPTASTTTKGGIKVGNGLKMNNGFLNVANFILGTKASTVEGAMWITDTDLPEPEPFEPEAYMTSYLPFTNSATEDLCGKTWTSNGAITVNNGVLMLNNAFTLIRQEPFNFTGQPFTANFNLSVSEIEHSQYTFVFRLYYVDGGYKGYGIQISDWSSSAPLRLRDIYSSSVEIGSGSKFSADGTARHIEIDFDGNTWYLFINGKIAGSQVNTPAPTEYTLQIGYISPYVTLAGTLDNFKFYDGVALHTANFTP